MKKEIFRKAALDRLSSPDQLDRVMKITSPLSWIALLGVTLIIAAVVVWSFTGSLLSTVTANGILVSSSTATNTIRAQGSGTVAFRVGPRDATPIRQGETPVADLTLNNTRTVCLSTQNGYVASLLVKDGDSVDQGTELIRVRPYVTEGQKDVVVCYVPISDVGKIRLMMEANITLLSESSSTSGHMVGRVINIDTSATSQKGIEAVVGADNGMVNQFMKDTSVCAVTCELALNSEKAEDENDYYWSNAKGRKLMLNDSMMCSVKIITETERPINKLFTWLKDFWGGKQ